MIGSSDGRDASIGGGPAIHHPVLCPEVMAALRPQADGLYVDGTFGAGGYTRAILGVDSTRVIALDRDPTTAPLAAAVTADFSGRFSFHQSRFSALAEVIAESGISRVDGVVFDIGVSSMQLDQPDRGFSFRFDGPLDMRMEQDGPSAADLVNTADETVLARIIYEFGEERDSRRIARAIVADRTATPFTRTKPLAELVGRVVRGAAKGVHPATKTFQALRIAVNDELGELLSGLAAAEQALAPGGVLAVVTFHSLEDRIVKRFFARAAGRGGSGSRHQPLKAGSEPASFDLPSGQPIVAEEAELERNPRARSAKLRFAVRTQAPAKGIDPDLQALAGHAAIGARR